MNNALLIKNGTIVTTEKIFKADLLSKNGIIEMIEETIAAKPEYEIIDASGLHVMAGVIDPQVHFREPGHEWKEDLFSGSRAAASGGVTTFLDMPNNKPSITTVELMSMKKKLASEKSIVNYNFFIGATKDNLEALNRVENVAGIKIFMGSSTGDLLVNNPDDLLKIFETGNKLIAVHSEDDDIIKSNYEKYFVDESSDFSIHSQIRSPEAAMKTTQLACRLSFKFKRRLHILHVSTENEVNFLKCLPPNTVISAEVCPQHLLLNGPEVYEKLGSLAQMNPPLRERHHSIGLWKGLKEGTIQCIATDHAPHTMAEKSQLYGKAPSGMPGVETSLPLMLNEVRKGNASLNDITKWMSEAPARLYGIVNRGKIEIGYNADLVIVDLKLEKTVQNGALMTKVNWSPYHGQTLTGWPVTTIVNGNIVFNKGKIIEGNLGQEVNIDPELVLRFKSL